jgi:hypothetical protein
VKPTLPNSVSLKGSDKMNGDMLRE